MIKKVTIKLVQLEKTSTHIMKCNSFDQGSSRSWQSALSLPQREALSSLVEGKATVVGGAGEMIKKTSEEKHHTRWNET